jgi:phosphatidylserine decarboxylase
MVRIDRAGYPFVGGALLAALLAAVPGWWWPAAALVVIAAFFLFFFRDPERRVTAGGDLVLSPADGRVLVAGPAVAGAAPPGEWLQISIFLSPLNVHVNRVPVSGRITRVQYRPGRYLPAYRDNAASVNERSEIWIDHAGRTVVARQIVGVLARRVVCRLQAGVEVCAGDRYGIMKFGSRMDVFLPATSEIRVQVGAAVRGGETVLAVLH